MNSEIYSDKKMNFIADQMDVELSKLKRAKSFREYSTFEGPSDKYLIYKGESYLNLISNDYLGLANHPKVKNATIEAVNTWGLGTGGARLLSGSQSPHSELEHKLSTVHGSERALLFNSGYTSNYGALKSLAKFFTHFYSDRLNHASIIDGLVSSESSFTRYRHADMEHLEELLEKEPEPQSVMVVTETLFSMEGDFVNFERLLQLQSRFGFYIYFDEAHSFGGYPHVLESIRRFNPSKTVVMGTFGKALGSFGAFITGPQRMIEWLINNSRPFIFSTALPAALAVSVLASLDVLKEEPFRRTQLTNLIQQFQTYWAASFPLDRKLFNSHIIPIHIGENEMALAIAELMRQKKFFVSAIRHPTVPKGTARLRLSLRCDFEYSAMAGLVDQLADCLNREVKDGQKRRVL